MRQRDREGSAYAAEPTGAGEPHLPSTATGEHGYGVHEHGVEPASTPNTATTWPAARSSPTTTPPRTTTAACRASPGSRAASAVPAEPRPTARPVRPGARRRGAGRTAGSSLILAVLMVALLAVAVWLVVHPALPLREPERLQRRRRQGGARHRAGRRRRHRHRQHAARARCRGQHPGASPTRPRTTRTRKNIQPGSYRLREHMPARKALALLLTPSTRVNSDVVVSEGATVFDVQQRLAAKPCTAKSPGNAIVRPRPAHRERAAAPSATPARSACRPTTGRREDADLGRGLPFPATYTVAGKTAPSAVLQQMISQFTDQARAIELHRGGARSCTSRPTRS